MRKLLEYTWDWLHNIQGELLHNDQDKQMAKNVQRALAVDLQDLSTSFRNSQSQYLKRLLMQMLT